MKLETKSHILLLHVKVVPNSSRTPFASLLACTLKIKVTQPAEGGCANRAVEMFLAKYLHLAPSRVSVIAGHANPRKTLCIAGLTAEQMQQKLNHFLKE